VQILPAPFRSALQTIEYGKLAVIGYEGQIHALFKTPQEAIRVVSRPPRIRHFLFLAPMPTAPVVGWFFEIQDEDPIQVNAFFNVEDPIQEAILAQLAETEVHFHIVDGDSLTIADSARIPSPFNASKIHAGALSFAAKIALGRYDYDSARAKFEVDYSLEKIATWLPTSF